MISYRKELVMSERGFVDERRRKQISTLSNPRNFILGPRNQCSDSRLGPSDLVALGGQAIPADPDRPADVSALPPSPPLRSKPRNW